MPNVLGLILIFLGSFVCLIASIGLYKLPGLFPKMHAATKTATLACGLVLIGVAIHPNNIHTYTEVIILILFIGITNPISAHYIAKRATFKDINSEKNTIE